MKPPEDFVDELRPGLLEKLALWKVLRYFQRAKETAMNEPMVTSDKVNAKTRATWIAGVITAIVTPIVAWKWGVHLTPEDAAALQANIEVVVGLVAAASSAVTAIAAGWASWQKRLAAADVATARLADGSVVPPQPTRDEAKRGFQPPPAVRS